MHATLDARRLMCPLPVIRTEQRAAGLAAGDTLEVICTDHGALQDIPAWCRVNGHELVSTEDHGEEVVITVRIGS